MAKTQATKPAVKPATKKIDVSRQDRKRFYYIRTKGRYGVLSPKVDNLDEALRQTGISKTDVTESKELSTNRHDSVVEFCNIVEAIPASSAPKTPAKPVEKVEKSASPITPAQPTEVK
ncbi:MAG: hypothetical protein WC346_20155 [Methanogenium sp.]|jgi:hypothetical protein